MTARSQRERLDYIRNKNGYMIDCRVKGLFRYHVRRETKQWCLTEYIGYTPEELRSHLESLFTNGMNFENFGEWEIDHIIAKRFFSYDSMKDNAFVECWSLNNLRPLWKKENHRKGYTIDRNGNIRKSLA